MRKPSPGRMLGAISDRLRGAGYVVEDVALAIARVPRGIGRGAAAFWISLPVIARRRLGAALGTVAVIVLVATVVVPNLPCSLPGGERCAPDDDAIALVPAGSLAYLHANVDPDTEQYEEAAELARRAPLLTGQLVGQLPSLLLGGGGQPPDFERQVAPWFGGEVAVFVTGSAGREQQVQLVETDDADRARAYAEELAAGRTAAESYRDIEILEDQRGLASALVDDFLVLGPAGAVRDVVDVATGAEEAQALADDPSAEEAIDELPEHRLAEAYLSREGLAGLAADPDSPLAPFEPFLDSRASRGAAIALSASDEGLALASRSLIDPERAEPNPGFFAAFEPFEPQLPEELPADALAYLGLGEPSETAEALLRQATAQTPAIARGFTRLVERLQRDADVNLEADLLPALGGEAAVVVVPRRGEASVEDDAGLPGQPPPQTLAPGAAATPYVELLATDVDEDRVRDALARVQGPLVRALGARLGAPVFDVLEVGDVEAQVLRVSPTVHLAYAVFDSTLALATDPVGVRRAVEGADPGLADAEPFERVRDELPDESGLLAYLDVAGLLRLGERSGLAADPVYATFAQELRRLGAFALAVGEEDNVLGADARLLIAAPDDD